MILEQWGLFRYKAEANQILSFFQYGQLECVFVPLALSYGMERIGLCFESFGNQRLSKHLQANAYNLRRL